ncbi:MAG TPA: hypothetical protein PKE57_06405 [Cellvibrionaceae bacterium]|nr:hypothetical protein [Cellvibrionaceae bacterium]HMW46864.1 hypothetical protein [Cellvibrionaceae bacterium]HMW72122.1 hypothetical protein [Cellvibrionaceae bacterium]HMY39311.1 hypothetical protein [Marinagarivorans sp.]HNG59790.1 hypothetical protein [Cellvibrionaceae bacterium]
MVKYLLMIFLGGICLEAGAVDTTALNIERVQFNASSSAYFAYRSAGWGVCNNTQFVQLQGAPENRQIFSSQVLAAHMAGKTVAFAGSCTNPNGYLDATYIIVN